MRRRRLIGARPVAAAAAALLAALLAGGCATVTRTAVGVPIEAERVEAIRPGETTEAEIIGAFGEPAGISRDGDGDKLVFRYEQREVPSYFGGLVVNEKRASVRTTTLEVTIRNGKVSSYRLTTTEK